MVTLHDTLRNMAVAGRALKAIIFDDEYETNPTPPLANWILLQDELGDLETNLRDYLENNGHNIQHAPPGGLITDAIVALNISEGTAVRTALEEYAGYKSTLLRLKEYLEALDFDVSCFNGMPSIDPLNPPLLCLVDYQIVPEGDAGETAISFFRSLMESSQANNFPPPYVFLMSKALTEEDERKWSDLAERGGLFRFNYGFLNKARFDSDNHYLSYPLLHHIKHDSLSRAYCEQVRSLSNETLNIAKRVVQRMFQVTPPEFVCFQSFVINEGGSLAQELLKVFTNLFATELDNSHAIKARMQELETVFSRDGMPVPYKQSRSALHQIYSEFLFRNSDGKHEDPHFADVYEIDDDRYALIISQECDLKSGGTRKKKVDRVLAVEGLLKEDEPKVGDDAKTVFGKPIYFSESDKRMWICWSVSSPLVIPLKRFTKHGRIQKFHQVKRLLKKWEMRATDAEEIQHLFSTGVTRVGTDITPEYVCSLDFVCYEDGHPIADAPTIFVYKTIVPKKVLVAIAPESQVAFLSINSGNFMSHERLTALSGYLSIADFKRELLKDGLMPFAIDGQYRLVKATQAYQRGKTPWNGEIICSNQ